MHSIVAGSIALGAAELQGLRLQDSGLTTQQIAWRQGIAALTVGLAVARTPQARAAVTGTALHYFLQACGAPDFVALLADLISASQIQKLLALA
jgi:hypothetical protein